ncbi:MAG: rod shape-determining protein [Firmicutes bacterium]|nr:rod shape-determining protein [Bacillota bacterium]
MLGKYFLKDFGIDLGTANCLVYERGKGIVLREPSVVAVRRLTREILAIGEEARQMIGRTPADIVAVRPLRHGVIADFDLTREMLRHLIRRVCKRRVFFRPRVMVSVPAGTPEVERRAVIEASLNAGAREAYLIEEPVAAAIGAGLAVHEPSGNMIIDIGGGTTAIAVISLGGVVTGQSLRIGGDAMDEAIARFIRRTSNLMIGERTAEELKVAVGSAFPLAEEMRMEVRGRDYVSGLPKTVLIGSEEIREALQEPLPSIINAVRSVIERTPPELVADIMHKEIVLTGGGALLRGIDDRLRQEIGMPVRVAEDPLSSVAVGTGRALERIDLLARVAVGAKRSH